MSIVKEEWSTDKIVGTWLGVALVMSIFIGAWTGEGIELQTTIASGLIGFMGRIAMEKTSSSDQQKKPLAEKAEQIRDVAEAVDTIAKTATRKGGK